MHTDLELCVSNPAEDGVQTSEEIPYPSLTKMYVEY
jgi:hypothetical protein